jgi:hypothetical protein
MMATQPTHSLIRDGIDKCADYIFATLRRKTVRCNVFVDRQGGIRVRTAKRYAGQGVVYDRPEAELVCTYTRATACLEYIREDLQDRLDSMPACVTRRAA